MISVQKYEKRFKTTYFSSEICNFVPKYPNKKGIKKQKYG